MKNKLLISFLTGLTLLTPISTLALTKDETIYTNLDSTGKELKSSVSSHLYINTKGDVNDQSDLKNILNINGHEEYKKENNIFIWKAEGKDIFYTGDIEKENPIKVGITYYLNDEEKSLKDILGKSGNVKIKFDFKNNLYDSESGLYTPFVVMVGTTLDNSNNRNVQISSGKVVSNGKDNILVGIAAPGLYESINLDEFKNLNNLTISFDTDKLDLKDFYLVATPKLLEDTDLSVFSKMDELVNSISVLQEKMNQIESGVKELEKGMGSIVNGSNELSNNLNLVVSSVGELENGAISLDEGVKQILNALYGAKQSLENKNVAGSLENLKLLKEQNTNTINVLSSTNESLKANYEMYHLDLTEQEIVSNLTNMNIDENTISQLITCKKTYEGNNNLILLLSTNNNAIDSCISSLTEMLGSINTLIDSLSTNLTNVSNGLTSLTNGLNSLNYGVGQLYDGSNRLYNGTVEFQGGLSTLSNGISEFNNQGINRLANFSYTASNYSYKAKKLVELSKNYNGYGSNNATNTTFVYKIKMS